MAVTTTIARHYFWRLAIMIVVCVALAVWGAYDLWVSIPYKTWINQVHTRWQQLYEKQEDRTIRTDAGSVAADTLQLISREPSVTLSESASEVDAYQVLDQIVRARLGSEEPPAMPAAFDHYVQWMFVSCILLVPYYLWRLQSTRQRNFALDDEGNLTLLDGTVWSRDEISSIDMSRWMAKSIAWVVHVDGRRVKLDAYLRAKMEQVIGRIAHRFEPQLWNEDGTQVKVKPAEDDVPEDAAFEETLEAASDPNRAADDSAQ